MARILFDRILPTLLVAACISMTACAGHHHDHAHAGYTKAIVHLQPTAGNDGIAGWVKFEQADGKVMVSAEVTGLTPGKHGFHIHQLGDISASDGKATGGHYNPEGHDHALADKPHRHAGDLGNLEADASGKAVYNRTVDNITIAGKNAILGRSIIVHAKEDDGGQPTGNAGARIAQGVIGVAK